MLPMMEPVRRVGLPTQVIGADTEAGVAEVVDVFTVEFEAKHVPAFDRCIGDSVSAGTEPLPRTSADTEPTVTISVHGRVPQPTVIEARVLVGLSDNLGPEAKGEPGVGEIHLLATPST